MKIIANHAARLAAAISACMTVFGCGARNEAPDTPEEEQKPLVEAVQVHVQDVPQHGVYTSTVLPESRNNIAPQMAGRIKEICVEIGDFLHEGQVMARMDDANLLQARLKMINDSTELRRLTALHEEGGLSQSDFDAIKLAYDISSTSYRNLLENTVLTSPVDGVVTARNYDEGDMFGMQQPIYVVENIVPVKLLAGISEVDYTRLHVGDQVEVSVDAFPGETFKGKINRFYPTIDPMTHTFKVEILVPNRDRRLRPGMFARVRILFGTNRSVVVPDAAVMKQTGSGERYVFVVEDGKVRFQTIELGVRRGYECEVLSGLSDGDVVVTKGQLRLRSGMEVTVKE